MSCANQDTEYLSMVGDYKPGTIVRIQLTNFMTHTNGIIQPGPRLNIVVGANGTGKSTILNAICLGLGGEPAVLGRADDLRAYIQDGRDIAEIEITLRGRRGGNNGGDGENDDGNDAEDDVVTFKRVIDRNKGSERGRGRGSSTMYINGMKAKAEEVRRVVEDEYHIAIDNLCTFLPQDKVGSFSGLSDQLRLVETEKTLFDSHRDDDEDGGEEPSSKRTSFYELHQDLIKSEEEIHSQTDNVHTMQDQLEKMKHENERLEREKTKIEERERALERAKLLKQKQIWLKFDKERSDLIRIKEERQKVQNALKEARHRLIPLQERHQAILTKRATLENREKTIDSELSSLTKDVDKCKSKFDGHDDAIDSLLSQMFSLDSQHQKMVDDYNQQLEKLEQYEQYAQNNPPQDQVENELEELTQQLRQSRQLHDETRKHDSRLRNQQQQLEEMADQLQSKLGKMNDSEGRQREHVFRQFPNLQKISQWIDNNRGEFRRPVHGPIICGITAKSKSIASYVEYAVPNNVLKSFVVENKADYDLIYNTVRQELKMPVNVILVDNGQLKPINRSFSDDKMRILKDRHGVIGYLDEAFTAADPILEALRSYASVHRVLVGGQETQRSIDDEGLLQYLSQSEANNGQLQGSCIFASNGDRSYRYTQMISTYSKKMNSKIDDIGPAKLLNAGVDPTKIKAIEKDLEATHSEMNELRPQLMKSSNEIQECERAGQELKMKHQAARSRKENIMKFISKVERQKKRVNDAKAAVEGNDTKAEKRQLAEQIMNRVAHSTSALEQHDAAHAKRIDVTISAAGNTSNCRYCSNRERNAREILEEKNSENSALEANFRDISKEYSSKREKAIKIKNKANEIARLEDDNGQPTELKQQLEDLDASTLEECGAALEEVEQIANNIDANPDVIRQYQVRKQEIEDLEEKLTGMTQSQDAQFSQIESKAQRWSRGLQGYIVQINKLFTSYMNEMGCAGEVRLKEYEVDVDDNDKSNNGEKKTRYGNFKEWGIEILVSFRENCDVQILSAHRHSGGERSVSTILYLMSLQELMISPFRCVDEINQGLDERNERLVFKRIVNNSTRIEEMSSSSSSRRVRNTNHSGQYFLITPKLLPNLTDMEEDGVTVLFVMNGAHNFPSPSDWSIQKLLDHAPSHSGDEEDV